MVGTLEGVYRHDPNPRIGSPVGAKVVVRPEQYYRVGVGEPFEFKDVDQFVFLVCDSLGIGGNVVDRAPLVEEFGKWYDTTLPKGKFLFIIYLGHSISINGVDASEEALTPELVGSRITFKFQLDYASVSNVSGKSYLNFKVISKVLIKRVEDIEEIAALINF